MTVPRDLYEDADEVAETIEQVGVGVDREALQDMLEELGPEGVEELLDATDPGGLLDELAEMDPSLLER